jgi:hypothetical protein
MIRRVVSVIRTLVDIIADDFYEPRLDELSIKREDAVNLLKSSNISQEVRRGTEFRLRRIERRIGRLEHRLGLTPSNS